MEAAVGPAWNADFDVDVRLKDVPLTSRCPDVVVYRAHALDIVHYSRRLLGERSLPRAAVGAWGCGGISGRWKATGMTETQPAGRGRSASAWKDIDILPASPLMRELVGTTTGASTCGEVPVPLLSGLGVDDGSAFAIGTMRWPKLMSTRPAGNLQ